MLGELEVTLHDTLDQTVTSSMDFFIHCYSRGTTESKIQYCINFISDYHDVNTRSSSNYSLHVPKPNLELFKTS